LVIFEEIFDFLGIFVMVFAYLKLKYYFLGYKRNVAFSL